MLFRSAPLDLQAPAWIRGPRVQLGRKTFEVHALDTKSGYILINHDNSRSSEVKGFARQAQLTLCRLPVAQFAQFQGRPTHSQHFSNDNLGASQSCGLRNVWLINWLGRRFKSRPRYHLPLPVLSSNVPGRPQAAYKLLILLKPARYLFPSLSPAPE